MSPEKVAESPKSGAPCMSVYCIKFDHDNTNTTCDFVAREATPLATATLEQPAIVVVPSNSVGMSAYYRTLVNIELISKI